ncbi:ArsR family transcriptional regulator [Methylobacterium frigidaeris]|uniref:ArsR family transcriptional regulator n=1 Tax=Methylobacterium frigidaeris TaxID=2038277 RepID=UPI001054784D|nr:ArsR family transcriptional regulator [Methylobacterium frigidaeris]
MPTDVATPEVMWTAARIAERDGVTREAVLKIARDLVAQHGLAVARDGRGRIAALNVVEYDHLRGRFGDPSKAQAPKAALPPPATDPGDSYDEALRQKAWHEVEKRRLEVGDLRKTLLRRDRYEAAVAKSAADMARFIDQLPQEADAIGRALGLENVHALRIELKKAAVRMRAKIAASFQAMAAEAPATDEEVPAE